MSSLILFLFFGWVEMYESEGMGVKNNQVCEKGMFVCIPSYLFHYE